ncbi:DDB1- and CUL4-associated factor 8 isoform X2 [Brassica rapa]|uniref:DDB1- and CUL4-associated factor 8 isoform X2 n=1 Tax=Brassica campestris TaxID=3711 RepID=UPI00142D352C|nr:DDB1- and CUL4-associated factor 8 isoform X2 [Brassica rapa]
MSRRPSKRQRSSDHTVVRIWERELGQLPNRSFSNRFSASEHLLNRLGLHKKLQEHTGCVNTVSFNADGDILVSGSDDRQVILWDWDTATVKLSFDSGHCNNIFQAKFMPFSDDRSIVTSSADGQVRYSKILESGQVETCMLGIHQGQVHKLAIEPGSPFSFYTCGEDGVVKHLIRGTLVFLPWLEWMSMLVSMTFVATAPRLGLAYSDQSELLASYTDEFIYLFSPGMGMGPNPPSSSETDTETETETEVRKTIQPQVYKEHSNRETVKGVGFFGPKCEYVVSGSDCGRIFIWRKKDGELLRAMEADKHVVNCIESHPHMPLMASSGIETDIKIWTPGGTEELGSPRTAEQASVSGNSRWFMFYDEEGDDHARGYYVADCDDDDEEEEDEDDSDDESSDDDESAEEEGDSDVDVEIRKDNDDDDEDQG